MNFEKHEAIPAHILDWPTDWDALFDRSAPMILEIGFGNGSFTIDLAKRRPDYNIIGIEIALPSIKKAEKKVRLSGLTNLRILHGSAWLLLWGACGFEQFDEVYINFPDPWWKDGHEERRLINQNFLHLLATRMKENGRLELATDHPVYQEHSLKHFLATPYFASTTDTPFVTEDLERHVTKYEEKARREGRTSHFFHYRRNNVAAENIFVTQQDDIMPHLIVKSEKTLEDLIDAFPPKPLVEEDVSVRYIQVLTSPKANLLFIEAHVREMPLPQRVGLSLRQRDNNEYIFSMHELGFPRPTVGVRKAIAHLAEWVMTMDENATVLQNNIPESNYPMTTDKKKVA